MFRNYRLRDYDFKLIILVAIISVIGIFAVGSAKASNQRMMIYGVIGGIVGMIILSFIDYHFVLRFYWVFYILNFALLAAVKFTGLGDSANNSQRWFQIGAIRFQPSELAKILLILFFAQFIMKHKEKLNTFRYIAICVVLFAVPWILIESQPDLSTSIILLILFAIIMFTGGLSYKIILGILAVVIPAFIIVVSLALQPDSKILKSYQQNRILSWINPEEYANDEAYQQLNSVTAIGSGQLEGKGYNNNEISSLKNGNYILEPQTDFIFAVIGEETGFRGCLVVIILETLIAIECFIVGRRAPDVAGRIIAGTMGGLISFQSFVNIGVATFLLPNTGLPLPFVSYGLSSLLSCYIGMGVVMNIRLQAKKSTSQYVGSKEDFSF